MWSQSSVGCLKWKTFRGEGIICKRASPTRALLSSPEGKTSLSKFRPQLQQNGQHLSDSVPAQGSSEERQISELRARSGIDNKERVPESPMPQVEEFPVQGEPQVSTLSLPSAVPKSRRDWLLLITTTVAFLSLAGIMFLGLQVYEVQEALRQVKDVSESVVRSARDAETAARAAESAVRNQAVRREAEAESSRAKPARAVIKKGRAHK